MNWYSVKKINERLFKISETHHWEHTNLYYLIGKTRNLLIDTGTGIKPLKCLLEDIDNKPIDVVLTHAHWDHIGNVHEFENVYVHKDDFNWVKEGLPIPITYIKQMMLKDVNDLFLKDYSLPPFSHQNPKLISNYSFEGFKFIHTPGHSPGSICLYDEKNKMLISGDILYKGTIFCHYESTDPKLLFESIKKINALEIKTVLSGHYEDPDIKIINSLHCIMTEFELENNLCHGGGLKCKDDICLQL